MYFTLFLKQSVTGLFLFPPENMRKPDVFRVYGKGLLA